jgi:hypothetical protein
MARKKSHQDHLNSSIAYIAILSVVAIVVFLISNTQKSLQTKNELDQKAQTRTELISHGINPDPVSIRQLSLNYSWEMSPFSYNARNAYLLPDVADFGDRREALKIGSEMKFLAVEMDVAYIKDLGQKQDIMVNKYVKVSSGGKSYQAVSADTVALGPNQNTLAYVLFAVPMTATNFSITTGNKTHLVDFSSPTIESKQGVFTISGGYAPEYK